jgi:hypothetical protein
MFTAMKRYVNNVVEEVQGRMELATPHLYYPIQDLSALASKVAKRQIHVVVMEHGLAPVTNGDFIYIPRRDYNMFTRRQIEAMIFHELGHIVQKKGYWFRSLAVEVSCDAFAAAAGYAKDLLYVMQVLGQRVPSKEITTRIAVLGSLA